MTGNTLTMNPITGQNPYVGTPYGTTPQGFWGNTGGFGGNTPFGFGAQASQTQQPYGINPTGAFTPQSIQQPGLFGQQVPQFGQQFGQQVPQFGQQYGQQVPQWQNSQGTNPQQMALQCVLSAVQQTCPPEVVNAILQTTPPQVLPYVLNALACQQLCQQVLAQNPQALQAINPQAITQPFQQTQMGRSGIGGFGQQFGGGYQQQGVPQFQQQGGFGNQPGTQPWQTNQGILGGLGQGQQSPFTNAFGTW